jgi:agmatine deiminase
VVTKRHIEILRSAKDAKGRSLHVVVLEAPSTIREKFATDEFATGYINFYICNGAVIAPTYDADAIRGDEQATIAFLKRLANSAELVKNVSSRLVSSVIQGCQYSLN